MTPFGNWKDVKPVGKKQGAKNAAASRQRSANHAVNLLRRRVGGAGRFFSNPSASEHQANIEGLNRAKKRAGK